MKSHLVLPYEIASSSTILYLFRSCLIFAVNVMLSGTIEYKHLNRYENFWRRSKGKVSVSEYYETFDEIKHALF